jgi:hypothetical protein
VIPRILTVLHSVNRIVDKQSYPPHRPIREHRRPPGRHDVSRETSRLAHCCPRVFSSRRLSARLPLRHVATRPALGASASDPTRHERRHAPFGLWYERSVMKASTVSRETSTCTALRTYPSAGPMIVGRLGRSDATEPGVRTHRASRGPCADLPTSPCRSLPGPALLDERSRTFTNHVWK